jgi:hypothetical protein
MSFPLFAALGVGYFIACKWEQWPQLKAQIVSNATNTDNHEFKEYTRDDLQATGHIFRLAQGQNSMPPQLGDGVMLVNPEDVYGPSDETEHRFFNVFERFPLRVGRDIVPETHDF